MATRDLISTSDLASWSIQLAWASNEDLLIERLRQAVLSLGLARRAQLYWLDNGAAPLLSGGLYAPVPDAESFALLRAGQTALVELQGSLLLYLPLICRQLSGWLVLDEPAEDAASLMPLLQLVAASLSSLRRDAESEAEVRNLGLLNEVGRTLNTTLALDEIILQLEEAIGLLLQTDHFYIALYDPRRGSFRMASFVEAGQHRSPENVWNLHEGLTGEIVRTGQAILTESYLLACAERHITPVIASGARPAHAWLGVPLQAERILGVIVVYSYQDGVRFSPRQLRLLRALADHSAAAIERAQLYERTAQMARQLTAINEIGRAMTSTLDPEEVPSLIMGFIQDILNVEEGSLLLRDEYTDELIFSYSLSPTGKQLLGTRIPPNVGIASEVVRTGQPILTNDAASHPAFYSRIDDNTGFVTRNLLCVPLRGRQGIQGVIEVMNRRNGELFTREDLRLLELVADQAAIALENARLYARTDRSLAQRVQELGERNLQLHEILQVANALMAATTLDDLLPQIASAVHNTSGFGKVIISLVHREPGRQPVLRRVAAAGIEPRAFARLQETSARLDQLELLLRPDYQRGYSTYLIDQGSGLYQQLWGVGGVAGDPWNAGDKVITLLRGGGGELLGLLTVGEPDAGVLLPPEQIQTLEIFASQASVALENAGLYEQQRLSLQGLTALAALGLAINSSLTTPEEILGFSIGGITEATGALAAGVLLRQTTSLSPVLQIGGLQRVCDELQELATLVLDTGKPRSYLAPKHQLPPSVVETGGRVLILYPLRGPNATLGVIYAIYPEALPAEREQELLSLFTGQAGVALESLRLTDAVREGRDRLASILSSTDEGIVMFDEAGEVVEANTALRKIFPKAMLEMHGATSQAFVDSCAHASNSDPGLWAELLGALDNVRAGAADEYHGRVIVPGMRPLAFAWAVLPISGSVGSSRAAILVLRDITGEFEAEKMRQDLTSMIVHDLRGPLASVLTAMEMLDRGSAGPMSDPQRQLLAMANKSSRKLLALIDTLLDISKLEAGQLRLDLGQHQLAPIIESVCHQYSPLIQDRQMSLLCAPDAQLPPARVDASHIERILQNLLDNAIKHSQRAMTISVRCAVVPIADLPAEHPPGDWLRVSICDEGTGIPSELRERIFEKFAQLDRSRVKGTGLGLTFCRLSVEAHGGRIWVEANEPVGSVFHFTVAVA